MSNDESHNATQEVFERVVARQVDAPDLHHGRLIHLVWRAAEQGQRLVQFYLNGTLSGASSSPIHRDAWLVVDHDRHIQIELLAVSPSSASCELARMLSGTEPRTSPAVSLAVMRDLALPWNTKVEIGVDDAPDAQRTPLFSPGDARGGFGAVFGVGGFGYDASAGPGFGRGELGYGPLGRDGTTMRWRSEVLTPGLHTIDLSLRDPAGALAAQAYRIDVTTDRLPNPPGEVAFSQDFKLTWT